MTKGPSDSKLLSQYDIVRRAVMAILSERKHYNPLSSTYEQIYNACRVVVTISGRGEDLYDVLEKELQKSLTRSINEIRQSPGSSLSLLSLLSEICGWYETQFASFSV